MKFKKNKRDNTPLEECNEKEGLHPVQNQQDEEFNNFLNDVLKRIPTSSAEIIKNSLSKTRLKAEELLKENAAKFDAIFDNFLVGVEPELRKKCHKIIHFSSLIAAIIGFSPIPFSDAVLLVPVQITMMMRLHQVFGASWTEGVAQGLAKELVVVGLGKSAVGNVLKLIPAVGTVAGGIINATVASTITETLGWVTVKMLNDGEDIFKEAMSFKGQFTTLLSALSKTKK
jgi:uncharacterized protein (DUF697 family)